MDVEAHMARTKEFDPDEAVDRAIEYFSRHTYHATAVRALARHMGISSSSFYDTFGDKHRVYLLALTRYLAELQTDQSRLYAETEASVDGLRRVQHLMIDNFLGGRGGHDWGLFAVNASFEMILADRQVRELLMSNYRAFCSILQAFFVRCQKAGTVPADRSPEALARYMMSVITSLSTLARLDPDRKVLEDMIAVALDALA